MSLQSMLSIARSALLAHQRAMAVTSQNVANASTPGYHRQRLALSASEPLRGPLYPLGRGVDASAIERAHDDFWDSTFRDESGAFGRGSTLRDYLGQVEATVAEPGPHGLSTSMDGLFQSFSDLSNDPASRTNRMLVVQAGGQFAARLRALDGQLSRVAQAAGQDMRAQVAEVNAITTRVAELNARILSESGAGGVAPDLMDQRGVLLDQLAELGGVTVLARSDGSLAVLAGQTTIVDGARATALAVVSVGAGFGVAPAAGGANVKLSGGSLAALADLTQNRLPALRAKLDQLAAAMVSEVNALHNTGYTLTGATGVDFFDPAGTTAATIGLSAAVTTSPDNIAAASVNAPGDGSLALQLAALSHANVGSLGGRSMRDHWVDTVATLGLDVRGAEEDTTAAEALVDHAEQSRQAVSGVNLDEEMVALIGQQQAYQAAARLISIADQMAGEILKLV